MTRYRTPILTGLLALAMALLLSSAAHAFPGIGAVGIVRPATPTEEHEHNFTCKYLATRLPAKLEAQDPGATYTMPACSRTGHRITLTIAGRTRVDGVEIEGHGQYVITLNHGALHTRLVSRTGGVVGEP